MAVPLPKSTLALNTLYYVIRTGVLPETDAAYSEVGDNTMAFLHEHWVTKNGVGHRVQPNVVPIVVAADTAFIRRCEKLLADGWSVTLRQNPFESYLRLRKGSEVVCVTRKGLLLEDTETGESCICCGRVLPWPPNFCSPNPCPGCGYPRPQGDCSEVAPNRT